MDGVDEPCSPTPPTGQHQHQKRTFDALQKPDIFTCSRHRDRLRNAGASSLVRPMRGYPEMIVRAIVAPGAERIMERLFSSEGDECLRFDVNLGGLTWAKVARVVLAEHFGTAIGFMDASGGSSTCIREGAISACVS